MYDLQRFQVSFATFALLLWDVFCLNCKRIDFLRMGKRYFFKYCNGSVIFQDITGSTTDTVQDFWSLRTWHGTAQEDRVERTCQVSSSKITRAWCWSQWDDWASRFIAFRAVSTLSIFRIIFTKYVQFSFYKYYNNQYIYALKS